MQEEYANWLLLDPRTRQVHNLPASQKEWADWKGVTPRTVRRWADKPEFQEFLTQRRAQRARELTDGATVTAADVGGARAAKDARLRRRLEEGGKAAPATAADDPLADRDLSPQERKFHEVHDALAELALGGSASAMDSYLKHFGKPFLEAMRGEDEAGVDLDDETLVVEVVRMLGPDTVAFALAVVTGDE